MKDRQIIPLEKTETEEGEIVYTRTSSAPVKSSALNVFVLKVLGLALGVALFLLFLAFFVYIVIPLIFLGILWFLIQKLFRSLR